MEIGIQKPIGEGQNATVSALAPDHNAAITALVTSLVRA